MHAVFTASVVYGNNVEDESFVAVTGTADVWSDPLTSIYRVPACGEGVNEDQEPAIVRKAVEDWAKSHPLCYARQQDITVNPWQLNDGSWTGVVTTPYL